MKPEIPQSDFEESIRQTIEGIEFNPEGHLASDPSFVDFMKGILFQYAELYSDHLSFIKVHGRAERLCPIPMPDLLREIYKQREENLRSWREVFKALGQEEAVTSVENAIIFGSLRRDFIYINREPQDPSSKLLDPSSN